MIILDCIQGSPEWHAARLGVVTASGISSLITPKTLKLSASRDKYMARLLSEWVTGTSAEEWGGNAYTEHGHDCEGEAASYFAFETDRELRHVGFIFRDNDRLCGCSPDALIVDAGEGLELKCPRPWTHIGWLREHEQTGQMPAVHAPQVQFSLWVTGYKRWWWMSYAAPMEGETWKRGARLPPLLVEVEPDPRWQDAFNTHVPAFLAEMLEAREWLASKAPQTTEVV